MVWKYFPSRLIKNRAVLEDASVKIKKHGHAFSHQQCKFGFVLHSLPDTELRRHDR